MCPQLHRHRVCGHLQGAGWQGVFCYTALRPVLLLNCGENCGERGRYEGNMSHVASSWFFSTLVVVVMLVLVLVL
jgi:hypothetical protein